MTEKSRDELSAQTKLVRDRRTDFGVVATPVFHASTVLFRSHADQCLLRLHAGLESTQDLVADLANAFSAAAR